MESIPVIVKVSIILGGILLTNLFVAPVVMGVVVTVRRLGKVKGTLLLITITFLIGYAEDERLFTVYLILLGLLGVMEIMELLLSST